MTSIETLDENIKSPIDNDDVLSVQTPVIEEIDDDIGENIAFAKKDQNFNKDISVKPPTRSKSKMEKIAKHASGASLISLQTASNSAKPFNSIETFELENESSFNDKKFKESAMFILKFPQAGVFKKFISNISAPLREKNNNHVTFEVVKDDKKFTGLKVSHMKQTELMIDAELSADIHLSENINEEDRYFTIDIGVLDGMIKEASNSNIYIVRFYSGFVDSQMNFSESLSIYTFDSGSISGLSTSRNQTQGRCTLRLIEENKSAKEFSESIKDLLGDTVVSLPLEGFKKILDSSKRLKTDRLEFSLASHGEIAKEAGNRQAPLFPEKRALRMKTYDSCDRAVSQTVIMSYEVAEDKNAKKPDSDSSSSSSSSSSNNESNERFKFSVSYKQTFYLPSLEWLKMLKETENIRLYMDVGKPLCVEVPFGGSQRPEAKLRFFISFCEEEDNGNAQVQQQRTQEGKKSEKKKATKKRGRKELENDEEEEEEEQTPPVSTPNSDYAEESVEQDGPPKSKRQNTFNSDKILGNISELPKSGFFGEEEENVDD